MHVKGTTENNGDYAPVLPPTGPCTTENECVKVAESLGLKIAVSGYHFSGDY